MQHARPNRLRRAVIYAALATLLGVVSLTLSQCTMVGDKLTGVDLNRGRPTTCLKNCNDFYALVYDQEQKYHDQAMLLCAVEDCSKLPAEQGASSPPDPCEVRSDPPPDDFPQCTPCPPDDPKCWFRSQEECLNDRQACKDVESNRHAAQKAADAAAKTECQNNCHDQGTGSAG